jgi:predicted SnoaL-like aldol condensation-catalyzing enzyme
MSQTLRQTAVEFLQMAASGRIDEAYERFVAADFRHHNAWFRGDRESLRQAMKDNATQNPDKALEVKMVLAEGDRVMLLSHVRLKPGDRGVALVHVFRFENGKIAELWDLGQPIPEDSPNENGMF